MRFFFLLKVEQRGGGSSNLCSSPYNFSVLWLVPKSETRCVIQVDIYIVYNMYNYIYIYTHYAYTHNMYTNDTISRYNGIRVYITFHVGPFFSFNQNGIFFDATGRSCDRRHNPLVNLGLGRLTHWLPATKGHTGGGFCHVPALH